MSNARASSSLIRLSLETIRASQGVAITILGATDWFHWAIKLSEAEMSVGLGTKLRAENQGERELGIVR